MQYCIKNYKRFAFIVALLFTAGQSSAQNYDDFKALFTPPLSYIVKYINTPLKMDGKLDELAWQTAAWTNDFTDIEGNVKLKPAFYTRVKMLWSDDYLYVAASLQEPQIWAKQQHHDDVIFRDNDFEIFVNPDNTTHRYFEIEVNALNKIFDLFMPKPYRNDGDALIGWNATGLQSAIRIDGTLNNPVDKDKGWTIEMAIPLKSLWLGYPYKGPREGTLWRINFSRVEWDTEVVNGQIEKQKGTNGRDFPEHNWVWSAQGVVNMHYPERWGYLQFTKTNATAFKLPYYEKQKNLLWQIYYSQKQYQRQHGHYADKLAELAVELQVNIDGLVNNINMEASAGQFKATITADGASISINDEGLIQYPKKP